MFYPVMKTEAFSLSFVVPIGKSVSNALSLQLVRMVCFLVEQVGGIKVESMDGWEVDSRPVGEARIDGTWRVSIQG